MAISKEIIKRCIADKRTEIEQAELVERPFEFEPHANYVFVGVRHVGKSYMLYQRVRQLLAQNIGWDELLFIDFEDERLAELKTSDLDLILETHLETYGKRPYIFFDEIQNVPHWDKFVRRLADAKYRIYVTGSNAKMLSRDVATTLGGRFFIKSVFPFSFPEYLKFKKIELEDQWEHSTVKRSEIKKEFAEYFYFGGLPEIGYFNAKRAMLSSLYQKIYLGDICTRNAIKNDRILNILIKKMAESIKQPISFNRLRNNIVSTGFKTSVPTVIDYVGYCEDSWLLLPIENEIAKMSDKESQKKYYFIDNGLLNLFIINPETSLLENLVAIQLCRKYGLDKVGYYNDNMREIDFVIQESKTAIQVAYSIHSEETRARETVPLFHFAETHPDWALYVITYDEEDVINQADKQINAIPIWKWVINQQ